MIQSHNKNIVEALGRNPVHPFPARMSPGIALQVLKKEQKLRVLDPMTGSGTVLAVAKRCGHTAIGVDLDPLAVLISRVWTTPLKAEAVKARGVVVLGLARRKFKTLRERDAYPAGADERTKAFIRYWFDVRARRQLTALAYVIAQIEDDAERDALWCAFSRLIITKSAGASLAMDLSHSRPHKKFKTAPVKPFNKFLHAVEIVADNAPARGPRSGRATRIICGDARKLPLKRRSVDLVLTSPPYLNAIDYMRCSKFSLVWMGHTVDDLRQLRGASVGSEVALPEDQLSDAVDEIVAEMRMDKKLGGRNLAIFKRYVRDMDSAVGEVARVLKKNGRAIYVVGDSSIKGTFVKNSVVVEHVASRHGLELVEKKSRTLPPNRRYLPPPSSDSSGHALGARMRKEVVLAFTPEPLQTAAR